MRALAQKTKELSAQEKQEMEEVKSFGKFPRSEREAKLMEKYNVKRLLPTFGKNSEKVDKHEDGSPVRFELWLPM